MKIQILREVQIDGVSFEPGTHDVAEGYAESLLNAGWATIPAKRQSSDEDDKGDERKAAPKRAAKPPQS